MARRKKNSGLEDLVNVLALLPGWACVALALLSYVVLNRLALPQPNLAITPGQIGEAITRSLWSAAAMVGQYLVPFACLVAAAVSAIRKTKRGSLVASVANSSTASSLQAMTWGEFELLVGEAFRLQGYAVVELGGRGPDGGVDLVLRKGREKFLVQCKQWKALKVSVQVVRELFGVMAAEGATGGFVVTSGSFTTDATEFARGRNMALIDGPKLFEMLSQAKARGAAAPVATPRKEIKEASLPAIAPSVLAPKCPKCATAMVERTAKRGSTAGRMFWGCVEFPACRETRPLV